MLIHAWIEKDVAFLSETDCLHIEVSKVDGIGPKTLGVEDAIGAGLELLEFVAKMRSALPDHKFILTENAKLIAWIPCRLLNPRRKNK